MAERKKRRPAQGFEDFAAQGVKIALIGVKIADMAFAAMRREPVGAALPAPVQNDDVEVSFAEIGRDLEIFLEELGPAREDRDCPGAIAVAAPARDAKTYIVLRPG